MSDVKEAAGANAASPTIRCFNGINSAQQKQVSGISFTPDCNGAANGSYFVEFINNAFSVYDKQTGAVVGDRSSDQNFWAAAGIDPSVIVDPRIVFIPDAGRRGQWLAVQINIGYRVLIATTDPNDPTADPRVGKWKAAAFDLPGNDFTMLGYDLNGIYIGVNYGGPLVPGDDRWPQLVFIPRAKALAWPPQVGPNDVKIMGPLPKNEYGENLFPMIDRSGAGWSYATAIGIDRATNRRLTFSLISPQFGTILSHGTIDVPPFVPVSRGFRVKQPFSNSNVMFDSTGIVAAPTGGGFDIWLAHTVLNQQYNSLAVRWYRLYIDPMTRMPGLAASGDIFQPHYDHFNPSILSLGKDDTTVVCLSRSGDLSTPQDPNNPACGNLGAYAALVRENGSGGGTYTVVPLKAGQVGNYVTQGSAIRWGDYSTICPDPDPRYPRRMWAINQFALQGGDTTSQWCNAIASIDFA